MTREAKNVLFCPKNIGLAKERNHTARNFTEKNDILISFLSVTRTDAMVAEKCCHIYEHKCCRFSDENLRFIAQ